MIQQATKLFGTKDFTAHISFNEYEQKVNFKYGIPLIVLDIIDCLLGTSFLKEHYAQVFPEKLYKKFDFYQDHFIETKAQIDPEFVPFTWVIFNSLG